MQISKNLESFDQVWSTIDQQYWQPQRLQPGTGDIDWPGKRDQLRPRVQQAKTMLESRAVMSELIALIGESHFAILPSEAFGNIDDTADKSNLDGEVGLGLTEIDRQVVIERVEPNSPSMHAGIMTGWIVEKINDESMSSVITQFDSVRSEMSHPEFMMGLLLASKVRATQGESIKFSFIDGAGKVVRKSVPAGVETGESVTFGNLPKMRLQLEQKTLENGVGYFRLSIFFNPQRVIAEFGKFVQAHRNSPGLIIDLRGNPGGVGMMATGMSGFLVDKPNQKLGTMFMRQGKVVFGVNPRLGAYTGPVVVLVDGRSLSTSEIMAGGLQDIGRARIIGMSTPGAALPSVVTKLPNGDRFQYAIADYISAGGKRLEGNGVTPDEIAKPTRQALLEGRNVALEAAINWIESRNFNSSQLP